MRRSAPITALAFTVATLVAVVTVLVAGWSPLLGLDLQGGVAVVLRPTTPADDEQLEQAISIIRNRVDAIGVAEPDISRQGDNVVVQLPGVRDQQRALELVGTTAELRFRPVLAVYPAPGLVPEDTTDTVPPLGEETDVPEPEGTTTTEAGFGGIAPGGDGELALGRQTEGGEVTTTTAAVTATTPVVTATTEPGQQAPPALPPDLSGLIPEVTPRELDAEDQPVVLPSLGPDGQETLRYQLGGSLLTGDTLSDASARLNPQTGEWFVELVFRDGAENVGRWREATDACRFRIDPCVTGQLAVVLDGEVLSAPTVQPTADFRDTNSAVITGQFTQGEARDLATALRYGALPVEFERQQTQEVSATIGRDALRAGVTAGAIGLVLIALYMVAYYRLLGLVAVASLALSFGLLWAIVAWLGETQGLALTLAGVVGIIVSIGVSVDSNIVYFEQIKDDMSTGRNLRSSSERAFRGAFSTIVKADVVSLIGASLLYLLTVGPVRGFALFLGLATLLDLVATWFFLRPTVFWLSRTKVAATRPKVFGIPAPRPPAAAAQVRA